MARSAAGGRLTANDLLSLQRTIGNRAVHRMLGGARPGTIRRATAGGCQCGGHDHEDRLPVQRNAARAGTLVRTRATANIQRDLLDDVEQGAANLVSGATELVSGAEQTVEKAVSSAETAIGNAASTVEQDVAGVVGGVNQAVTGGGAPPAAGGAGGASALALTITPPDITIAEVEEETETLPLGIPTETLFDAGFEVGPFVIEGWMGTIWGDPEVTTLIGPLKLQNIKIVLDPLAGNYAGTGQLYLGSAMSGSLEKSHEAKLQAAGVIPMEPPIPIVASAEAGIRTALRLVAKEGFSDTVSVGYSGGNLGFRDDIDMKLGGLIEVDHEAFVRIEIEGEEICSVIWPLSTHRVAEGAVDIGIPITVGVSSGGSLAKIGKPTVSPIPFDTIQTALQGARNPDDCMDLKELAAFLCKKGKLPPDICAILVGPTPPGPLCATPPCPTPPGPAPTGAPCVSGPGRSPTGSGGDFHHYSRGRLSGPIKSGQDWTDYYTNSQKESQGATGVPDDICYRATLKESDASPYIPRDRWSDRNFYSIVFNKVISVRHFTATSDVPDSKYTVDVLDASQ
jgi:hypothetical protein